MVEIIKGFFECPFIVRGETAPYAVFELSPGDESACPKCGRNIRLQSGSSKEMTYYLSVFEIVARDVVKSADFVMYHDLA